MNGFRASTPFLDGGMVILSAADQDIAKSGIKYVLLNEQFVDAIETLQQAYPNVEFIKPQDAAVRLKKIVQEQSQRSTADVTQ